MRLGSLCTGLGGLELLLPGNPVWHAETDPACSALLERRFPGVPNLGDITAVDWRSVEPVDLLVAGPPCQPSSVAGKRMGPADERWLWSDVWRAIRVLRPRLVLLENPIGIFGWLGQVFGGLAEVGGYETRWICLRASDIGAPHRRERWFCLATADSFGGQLQRRGNSRDLGGSSPAELGQGDQRQRAGDAAGDGREDAPDASGQRWGEEGSANRRAACSGDGRPLTHCELGGRDCTPTDPNGSGLEGAQPAGRRLVSAGGLVPDADRSAVGAGRWGRGTAGSDSSRPDPARWGPYEPAIRRWEQITRPAPPPVDERGRLSPRFVEWLMGFPEGWTDGMTRNQALKALGNAVLPLQARVAWDLLAGEQ